MSETIFPPKWPLNFLRFFLKESYLEEIEGDMEEIFYENLELYSEKEAKQKYAFETLKLLRPVLIKNLKSPEPIINRAMFKHNLIITLRNFMRHKTSFVINLLGLSAGLACFLLIYLWVQDELKMDIFPEEDENIFQVVEHATYGEKIGTSTNTTGALAPALAEEMPEVLAAATARTKSINSITLNTEDINLKAEGLFASKNFFKVFPYLVLQGDRENLFPDHGSVVITESLAKRLFGKSYDIIGRKIEWQHEWPLQITGVIADLPPYSTLQFDLVVSFEAWAEENEWVMNWHSSHPQSFLLLKPGTDVEKFNTKISDFIAVRSEGTETHRSLEAIKYSDLYLYGNYENGQQAGGRIEYIWLFSIVALFIILIACINFMNLSTARATQRMKEVGIKKSVGARRHSLMLQYLMESCLLSFLALAIAFLFVFLFLPEFNTITGKQLSISLSPSLIWLLIATVLGTGLIAGSYPAIYLSSLRPIEVIKGKLKRSGGELWLRKGLVVLQFSLSIIMIVSVWVVYKQIEYTQTQNLGYNRENVIMFRKEGRLTDPEHARTFISELRGLPEVINASSILNNMTGSDYGTNSIEWPGKVPDDNTVFDFIQIDYDMIELLNMEMAVGRSFSREFGSDTSGLLFNEAAIEYMGLEDPLNSTINWGAEEFRILGVVKDFHLESFHDNISPLFFSLGSDGHMIMVKVDGNQTERALAQVQTAYEKHNPGFPLEYAFLDEEYAALYAAEQKVSQLSKYFAGLAILISCLGLFGLAMFTAAKRQKEIGIRKVLGASSFQLVRLLSDDYTKMVGLAILFALPISYFLVQNWLEGFVYSISLQWWYFLGSGLLALLIAWFTVGIQTARAASVNPVKSLRDE